MQSQVFACCYIENRNYRHMWARRLLSELDRDAQAVFTVIRYQPDGRMSFKPPLEVLLNMHCGGCRRRRRVSSDDVENLESGTGLSVSTQRIKHGFAKTYWPLIGFSLEQPQHGDEDDEYPYHGGDVVWIDISTRKWLV